MTENAPTDLSGDYSYDLAHEVPPVAPPEPMENRDGASPSRVTDSVEAPPGPDGDYSYDLAHEVPPPKAH